MSMTDDKILLPEVIVYAGPNGSGKTTITKMAKTAGMYINADDIKKASLCTDLETTVKAQELREKAISDHSDFTFETVLYTEDLVTVMTCNEVFNPEKPDTFREIV